MGTSRKSLITIYFNVKTKRINYANQKTVLHCAVESYSDEVAIYLVDKGNSVDEACDEARMSIEYTWVPKYK